MIVQEVLAATHDLHLAIGNTLPPPAGTLPKELGMYDAGATRSTPLKELRVNTQVLYHHLEPQ